MIYHVYYEETYGNTYLVEASSEEEAKERVLDGLMEGSLDGPETCQSSAARIMTADELMGEDWFEYEKWFIAYEESGQGWRIFKNGKNVSYAIPVERLYEPMMTTGISDFDRARGVIDGFEDGLNEDAWFAANKDWVSRIIDDPKDVHQLYDWICTCDWR